VDGIDHLPIDLDPALYALLNYAPAEHLRMAKYSRPYVPYEAQFRTTNTGVPHDVGMICGHNPYIEARLARDLRLIETDGSAVLRWKEPDRLICNPRTLHIERKDEGAVLEAPVRLPLANHS
jgi:hypothetical protein